MKKKTSFRRKTAVSIGDILSGSSTKMHYVLNKSKQIAELNAQVIPKLDEDMQAHCRVANFNQGVLVIEVDSGAWAMRLRYAIPDLLRRLRSEDKLFSVSSIKSFVGKNGSMKI